jgi:branched-chain amino acid transport system permease protein
MDLIINGLLLGGLYTLFALGLSLVFGVMRLTNVAHGDFIILGTFAVIAGTAVLRARRSSSCWSRCRSRFGFGYAMQRYVLNSTLGKDPLPSLVVTFGLSIVVQNALLEMFSADPRSIETGGLNIQSVQVAGVSLGVLPLIVLGLALASTAGLHGCSRAPRSGARSVRCRTTARSRN